MLCKVKPYSGDIPKNKRHGMLQQATPASHFGNVPCLWALPHHSAHKENLIISLNNHRSQGCKIGKDLTPIIKEFEQFFVWCKASVCRLLHGVQHWAMMKNMDTEVGEVMWVRMKNWEVLLVGMKNQEVSLSFENLKFNQNTLLAPMFYINVRSFPS